jgi:hypothetical protein
MKRKQLFILLAALLVVGSAGLILVKKNKESWSQTEAKMGDKVLPDFQPNAVAAIHIKGNTELNLLHSNELWVVQERNNYPANFHQISDVLIKLKNLKVIEADSVDPSDLARVNLDAPGKTPGSGTLVEFKDGQGKLLASLLVGKKHMRGQSDAVRTSFMSSEPDGCYVLVPSQPGEVMLVPEPLTSLQASPEVWFSKDFIKVDRLKSCALASTNPADSWKISRDNETSDWTLAGAQPGETLDAGRLRQITNMLAAPRFNDVFPGKSVPDTALANPMVITAETFDNFTYTIKVGAKTPDGNYYMTVNATAELPGGEKSGPLHEKLSQEQALGSWVYTVGFWIMDPMLHPRAQLLQGYQEQDANAAPEKRGNSLPGDATWKPRVIQ